MQHIVLGRYMCNKRNASNRQNYAYPMFILRIYHRPYENSIYIINVMYNKNSVAIQAARFWIILRVIFSVCAWISLWFGTREKKQSYTEYSSKKY